MTPTRLTTAAPALLAVALLCAACGGGSPTVASTAGATSPSGGSSGGSGPGARQVRMPGASGLVAAVEGRTLQVQGNSEQTAVTYTASTKFTHEVAATLADVTVGVCVVARDTATQGSTPGTSGSTGQSPIHATSIGISSPVQGRCTGGFAGAGGGFGRGAGRSGTPGATRSRPATPPTGGRGSEGRPPNGFGGRGVLGTVTALDGGTITVQTVFPGDFDGRTSTGTATSTPTTRTVRVATGSSTTYTRTATTTSRSVVVGVCVTALGRADDTGAVTATSIAVRPAVNGSCTGLGGRGNGSGTGAPRA